MKITGLTEEQCNVLDEMWNINTPDEFNMWLSNLPARKLEMAMVLRNMLIQEVMEEQVKDNNLAKDMLMKINVKVQ